MNRATTLGVQVLIAGLCGAFYFTPHYVVKTIREAAARRDTATLAKYVDFPAVRASLKAGFREKLAPAGEKTSEVNPIAALGSAFVMALLDPLVDAVVTPAGLSLMMQGETPSVGPEGVKRAPTGSPAAKASAAEVDTHMGYESWDRFAWRTKKKGSNEEPVVLVLRRESFVFWKLSEIRLPL